MLKTAENEERDYVTFCVKIKIEGNENIIAEMKRLTAKKMLTRELIRAIKNRKNVQQELPI